MNTSSEVKELFAALAKAQRMMEGAKKDAANPFFKSNYADLQSVWESIRVALTANGLSVIQPTDVLADGSVIVITRLCHSSGQWIEGRYPVVTVKNDAQGLGSGLTYARRYSLSSLVGAYGEDDDGNSASGKEGQGGNLKITAKEMDAELGAKPKSASKAVVKPLDPKAELKTVPTRDELNKRIMGVYTVPTRDELNKRIMGLYKPYLTAYPQTKFNELLTSRYEVGETRLMTTEQMLNLAEMMEEQLEAAKELVKS